MERVDAKSRPSARYAASTQVRRAVPDPQGHATLLVRTYGMAKALQIAQTNSSITLSDDYWTNVFGALANQRDAMSETAQRVE